MQKKNKKCNFPITKQNNRIGYLNGFDPGKVKVTFNGKMRSQESFENSVKTRRVRKI